MLYMGEIVCNIIYIVVLYPVNAVLYAICQHILIIYLAHRIHDVSMSGSGQYIFPNFLLNKLSKCVFLIVIGTYTLDLLLANNIKFVLFKFNYNLLMLNQS